MSASPSAVVTFSLSILWTQPCVVAEVRVASEVAHEDERDRGVEAPATDTHASSRVSPAARKVGFVLVSELGRATPAISWKVQGSLDGDTVADGSASFSTWPA